MAVTKESLSLDNLITQALKIPGVRVNRAEFLSTAFANEGILVRQIVEEGPVACDYSDVELDTMADKLIFKRTSESSAMSFAAGIPGGLAIAATIPADTLQFFAMSLRLTQELAYLYGAKDFFSCEGEEGMLVRSLLICSLGTMYGIEGAAPGTRLLASHLALRAVGGTPTRATTIEFWKPIVKSISKELTVRLTTDTASKGVAKLIPVIGGFFSGGMTFFAMRPMGQKLEKTLSETSFRYDDSAAMRDYLALESVCEKAEAEQILDIPPTESTADSEQWGARDDGPVVFSVFGDEPAEAAASDIPIGGDNEDDGSINITVNGKPENAADAGSAAAPADSAAGNSETNAGSSKDAAPSAAPVMTMDEVFATIEKLAALRDKGAITQEDFDAKKSELLARI